MYRVLVTARFASIAGFALLMLTSFPVWAQRTGDHIVPSQETVCDGDPFSFGLCNAYCEALDCDSATPLGTPRACSRLLRNYKKKSGGIAPPCVCPCRFDLESDFDTLVTAGDAEFAPPPIDIAETFETFCGAYGPNGENAFAAEAFQTGEDTNQGVRLFYWVDAEPAVCHEQGGGRDGEELDDPLDWHYGPWIDRYSDELSETEEAGCLQALRQLCPPD